MEDVAVTEEPERSRYVIWVDGQQVGLLDYRRKPDQIALIHTEVDPTSEHHGLGSALVARALDDARSEGMAVLPYCPFVAAYIKRHPEYLELVPEARRHRFGL
jgi:predicted GNAT family acetyltransferase